jgi:hypothetical protein
MGWSLILNIVAENAPQIMLGLLGLYAQAKRRRVVRTSDNRLSHDVLVKSLTFFSRRDLTAAEFVSHKWKDAVGKVTVKPRTVFPGLKIVSVPVRSELV